MSETPTRVSIGMPVRDGERFLEEALNSLLAQELADFELIVSDNGSTDRTEAICRRYAKRDRRIRYHRHAENRGAAWNFNFVFQQAGGKYFKWAAHDDTCAPTFLSRCVNALEKAPPSVVLCYARTIISAEDGSVSERVEAYPKLGSDQPSERLYQLVRYINYFSYFTPVFGVARSHALRQTRLIGPYVASDWILLAELALLGPFIEVPEFLMAQRVHAGMSSKANRTDAELLAWFDPGKKGSARKRYQSPGGDSIGPKLFKEYMTAIARSDLSPAQKAKCCSALLGAWWRRRTAIKTYLAGQAP